MLRALLMTKNMWIRFVGPKKMNERIIAGRYRFVDDQTYFAGITLNFSNYSTWAGNVTRNNLAQTKEK
ncbi:MAG: hypothetical protein CM15mP47_1730 [Methanobacteriota archaeon]|nr:MAG: hypothetical protein CM15mP47_1730 [Euryarchaeota archaeon]